MDIRSTIQHEKIIVIVRQVYGDSLLKLAEALRKGGIRLMEVTFDQGDSNNKEKTCNAITSLMSEFGDDFGVGVGTTLTVDHVRAAHEAGAKFIISPNSNELVIAETKKLGMISIPGAMTPTEILNAASWGADYVKIFPVGSLGLKYCKDVMAPINHLNLIATAGVKEDNFGEILDTGFVGAGISGRLTDKKLIETGDWPEFTKRAEAFVKIAHSRA